MNHPLTNPALPEGFEYVPVGEHVIKSDWQHVLGTGWEPTIRDGERITIKRGGYYARPVKMPVGSDLDRMVE